VVQEDKGTFLEQAKGTRCRGSRSGGAWKNGRRSATVLVKMRGRRNGNNSKRKGRSNKNVENATKKENKWREHLAESKHGGSTTPKKPVEDGISRM